MGRPRAREGPYCSPFQAAEAIKEDLPPGRGFSCYDTSKLISTLRDIFQASIVFSKHAAR